MSGTRRGSVGRGIPRSRLQKRTRSSGSPGFAKDKARPIIFGLDTVAVWIPDVKENKGEHARGKLQSSRRRLPTDPAGPMARALRVRLRRVRKGERPLNKVARKHARARRVQQLRIGEGVAVSTRRAFAGARRGGAEVWRAHRHHAAKRQGKELVNRRPNAIVGSPHHLRPACCGRGVW